MKPILEFQVNGSFNILKQTIEGMTDEEWTSRPYPSANLVGFTAWHSLRTIDWAINTAIRGVPELAADPEWRDRTPAGAYVGAGAGEELLPFLARPLPATGRDHHVEITELRRSTLVGAGDHLLDDEEHTVGRHRGPDRPQDG